MIPTEGGCLCTAVRYRVHGAPHSSIICHCVSCRRASAAATVAWITVERAAFELVRGEVRFYKSSPGVTRGFCGACGSQITYENASNPNSLDVTTASLDDPNAFAPNQEVWLEDKIRWQPVNPTLQQHRRGNGEAV
jgi:hypothetical protein